MYESRLSYQPSGADDDTVATGLPQSKSIISITSITSIISIHVHLGSDGLIACFICGPAPATPSLLKGEKRGFLEPKTNRKRRLLIKGICICRPPRPARYHAYKRRRGKGAYGPKGR